ncbi:uncharacterized protein LOC125664024 [Ostrea edulis]|uniref:uncharacterized protein LOC125664024 n=1 Tax=Ostrea edulis TaxID=37623 RepID=UPI0020960656|nr:uncharacterized protein LOC125664024 [Ostrea edulis]
MYATVSVIVLSILLPEVVFGACRFYSQEMTAMPGKKVTLDCLYKSSIRVPYQQSYRDHETCEDCQCTETGLECCGFGSHAGTFKVEGCIEKTEGCYSTFVDANDPTKPCPAMQTTTQAPPSPTYRNPFAIKDDNSLFNSFGSPNSLYNVDNWKNTDKQSQRKRQYELLMSFIKYYLINNN